MRVFRVRDTPLVTPCFHIICTITLAYCTHLSVKQDRPVIKLCPSNQESDTVPGQNYAVFSWAAPSVASTLSGQPLQCSQPCPSGTNGVKCFGKACASGSSFTGNFPIGSLFFYVAQRSTTMPAGCMLSSALPNLFEGGFVVARRF